VVDDDEYLLSLQIDNIYGLVPGPPGGVRRLVKADVHAVFGWSPRAAVLAITERVARLTTTIDAVSGAGFAPEVVPPVVELLRAVIDQDAPGSKVKVAGGPSFVFPDALPALPPVSLFVIASDGEGIARARQLVRPSNWEPDEWQELVSGALGHWAMALDGEHPVSICHTPGGGDDSVECGVWTRADHRGAGLATATAKAWWVLERQRKRIQFYSTDHDNLASRGVARRLGLQPLGWLWTIR
jgi:hypothetical protein